MDARQRHSGMTIRKRVVFQSVLKNIEDYFAKQTPISQKLTKGDENLSPPLCPHHQKGGEIALSSLSSVGRGQMYQKKCVCISVLAFKD
ncbi:MAG: hypothetical protein A2X87_01700 [Deltaproteobacteria bacterium GWC2_42_51]|nr:MAG: hypothetical protein A2067_05880 [Deltaproteobacteria bacterium GWB2_42_7]OGP37239.1 MAG: hypothetical protein A2X87_01700 [Deltaproteobacteria bacterium GWC2_42_51]OGP39379.1 MAG: hypothetical protein A2090_10595 [Deltaproteobacteria bacterium GWD2_42_10]OGP47549.1 MAG: hypothetical protein A2022_09120 [Deltaproteobacteria bacterium GWF2_42_12]OGQ24885.1 MAG: hypothetical protein A3D29_00525 [Deltaproteobacteria bacterium RIFCSPHIGHO2_02_FULL_42_44]OGQ37835.1 MAG: hypothetical protein